LTARIPRDPFESSSWEQNLETTPESSRIIDPEPVNNQSPKRHRPRLPTMADSSAPAAAADAAPPTEAVANLHLDEVTGEKVSKSELKKRQKARQKEAEKAAKAAAAPPKPTSAKKSSNEADEKALDPRQYFEIRSRAINKSVPAHTETPSSYQALTCSIGSARPRHPTPTPTNSTASPPKYPESPPPLPHLADTTPSS
jgi:hypothetical protein